MLTPTDVQSLSAADAGNFQRTHDNGAKVDGGVDARSAQLSPDASAIFRNVDLLSASKVDSYSQVLFARDTYNEHQNHIAFMKRRKPPEYVGYAVNVDSDVDEQKQLAKSKEILANNSGVGDKTNVIKIPVYGEFYGYEWKAGEDRVWRAACRELNCTGGSTCVPDMLRDGRHRCQCPLDTDGHRCERRTSAMKFTYSTTHFTNMAVLTYTLKYLLTFIVMNITIVQKAHTKMKKYYIKTPSSTL